jgi:hypothetical protein
MIGSDNVQGEAWPWGEGHGVAVLCWAGLARLFVGQAAVSDVQLGNARGHAEPGILLKVLCSAHLIQSWLLFHRPAS